MSNGYAPFIAHMGICCFDIERMIDFYGKVFDLRLTDRGVGITFPYKLAFMSADPSQHHQFALAQNRPEGSPSTLMQVSFKVNNLAELREARNRALAHGASKMRCISHGNAVSIYCMDPEDNIVHEANLNFGRVSIKSLLLYEEMKDDAVRRGLVLEVDLGGV